MNWLSRSIINIALMSRDVSIYVLTNFYLHHLQVCYEVLKNHKEMSNILVSSIR